MEGTKTSDLPDLVVPGFDCFESGTLDSLDTYMRESILEKGRAKMPLDASHPGNIFDSLNPNYLDSLDKTRHQTAYPIAGGQYNPRKNRPGDLDIDLIG